MSLGRVHGCCCGVEEDSPHTQFSVTLTIRVNGDLGVQLAPLTGCTQGGKDVYMGGKDAHKGEALREQNQATGTFLFFRYASMQ
jgi:hypothetical protein